MHDDAVVLVSGGQDSTTCLAAAIRQWGRGHVHALSINYGQRHAVELRAAEHVCRALEIDPPYVLTLAALKELGGAALTSPHVRVDIDAEDSGNQFAEDHNLPSTFVPGRNVMFLTLALAYGARAGVYDVVTGVCETDRAGYPDCRSEFIASLEATLRLALDEPEVTIHAPLLTKSKADTWALADDLGILGLIVDYTHTCYHGDRTHLFDWGYGCGACGACIERRDGYEKYMVERRARQEARSNVI